MKAFRGSVYNDFHPEYFNDDETPKKAQKLILFIIAGAVVEEILTGSWDYSSADSDFSCAIDLAIYMTTTENSTEKS